MPKKILLFGTFDGLHKGHEDLFRQARERASIVEVVIARDDTVTNLKGRPAKYDENARLRSVAQHPYVTHAHLGFTGTDKHAIIKHLKPDLILLGYDQIFYTETLAAYISQENLPTQIQRAASYKPEIYKSHKINNHPHST